MCSQIVARARTRLNPWDHIVVRGQTFPVRPALPTDDIVIPRITASLSKWLAVTIPAWNDRHHDPRAPQRRPESSILPSFGVRETIDFHGKIEL